MRRTDALALGDVAQHEDVAVERRVGARNRRALTDTGIGLAAAVLIRSRPVHQHAVGGERSCRVGDQRRELTPVSSPVRRRTAAGRGVHGADVAVGVVTSTASLMLLSTASR